MSGVSPLHSHPITVPSLSCYWSYKVTRTHAMNMWFLEMTVINSWLCCIYRLLACLPFFSWWDPVCRRPHLDNIPALLFICDRFKTWLMIDECSSHCSWQQDRCFMRLWWTPGISHTVSFLSLSKQTLNIELLMIRERGHALFWAWFCWMMCDVIAGDSVNVWRQVHGFI